jgi:hypothetical protein
MPASKLSSLIGIGDSGRMARMFRRRCLGQWNGSGGENYAPMLEKSNRHRYQYGDRDRDGHRQGQGHIDGDGHAQTPRIERDIHTEPRSHIRVSPADELRLLWIGYPQRRTHLSSTVVVACTHAGVWRRGGDILWHPVPRTCGSEAIAHVQTLRGLHADVCLPRHHHRSTVSMSMTLHDRDSDSHSRLQRFSDSGRRNH